MAGSLDEVIGRLGEESEIIRQLGKERLKEMLTPKTAGPAVVLPPQLIELKNWLAEDSVKGKFVKWWPRKIATAKAEWRVGVSPIWDALASLLDRLFPRTCNTFNQFEPRPHVTEEQLYPYLKSGHGLSADEVDNLSLVGLLQLLQGDVEKLATSAGPVARPSRAEYNVRARDYLKQHPHAGPRELIRHLGCGVGTVYKLEAFLAVRSEHKKGRKPKAVSLTKVMESVASKDDGELARLVAEQRKDLRSDRVGAGERL